MRCRPRDGHSALIMSHRLTDAYVKTLPVPASGNKITYDADMKGSGAG